VTRAVLLAITLSVVTMLCFFSYTDGLIEGVKMSHTHALPPSDISF
jgi:hypothetical protein